MALMTWVPMARILFMVSAVSMVCALLSYWNPIIILLLQSMINKSSQNPSQFHLAKLPSISCCCGQILLRLRMKQFHLSMIST